MIPSHTHNDQLCSEHQAPGQFRKHFKAQFKAYKLAVEQGGMVALPCTLEKLQDMMREEDEVDTEEGGWPFVVSGSQRVCCTGYDGMEHASEWVNEAQHMADKRKKMAVVSSSDDEDTSDDSDEEESKVGEVVTTK